MLADLDLLVAVATHVETLVVDQVGDCPPCWAREPIVAHWVQALVEQDRGQR